MYIIGLEKVAKTIPKMEGAKDIYKQIPLSRKDGVPTFSFRVFTIEPGGHTPFHRHPFEHMNYVIDGQGILVTEDGERRLKKSDFALIMPDEQHQFKNPSKSRAFRIICAVPKEYE